MEASRRRLHALVLSLALHAGLALLLVLPPTRDASLLPPAARDAAVEVEIVDDAPPRAPAAVAQAPEPVASDAASAPAARVRHPSPKASPAPRPAAPAAGDQPAGPADAAGAAGEADGVAASGGDRGATTS
jgi:hypothetical protein